MLRLENFVSGSRFWGHFGIISIVGTQTAIVHPCSQPFSGKHTVCVGEISCHAAIPAMSTKVTEERGMRFDWSQKTRNYCEADIHKYSCTLSGQFAIKGHGTCPRDPSCSRWIAYFSSKGTMSLKILKISIPSETTSP